MPVGYRVEVYYKALNRATVGRGGPGGGWIYRVSRAMIAEARAEAPVRSGDIKGAHRINRDRGGNQWVQRYNISNGSDHAEYVHEGTSGPIRPKTSRKLVLPPGGGYPKILVGEVSGQRANPWLERACTRVAMRYGAVPTSA